MGTEITAPTPICKAMLVCETTIVEAQTGKVSIIGIFTDFHPPALPALLQPFQVFLQVCDACGRYDLAVEIQDLQDQNTLVRAEGILFEMTDASASMNIIVPVPSLKLAHGGVFDIVAFANDDEISRQKFVVREASNASDTVGD